MQKEEIGMGWKNHNGYRSLLGFSHGVAGIVYALERLAEAAGNDHWKKIANQALMYERFHFIPEQNNWPDFRVQTKKIHPVQWCHGATGVGFGRLYSPFFQEDPKKMEEVQAALEATTNSLPNTCGDHCCCGYAGKINFLISAAKLLKEEKWKTIAQNELVQMVNRARTQGGYLPNNLLPRGTFSPGFMHGFAGIGYALLQMTDKGSQLPQVLVLE